MSNSGGSKLNVWMALAGAAVVVGFFLPLINLHGLAMVSGWELVTSGNAELGQRVLAAAIPVCGVLLVLTALAGAASARWFALALGGLIIVYPAIKLAAALVEVAGSGAFLMLGGGFVALVTGLAALASSRR